MGAGRRTVALTLVVASLATGCGGSGDGDGTSGPTGSTTAGATDTATATGAADAATATGATATGTAGAEARVTVEGPLGKGANAAWLFRPAGGAPSSVVVFLHGLGDQAETTPVHHEPWLRHLAAGGSAVIYPSYEATPGADASPLPHVLAGVKAAYDRLPDKEAPLVLIGFSRGGRLAVELAAVIQGVGLVPRAVLSVFPSRRAQPEPEVDLRGIDPDARVVLLAGDRDRDVGIGGVRELLTRLEAAGFPAEQVEARVVESDDSFAATHLSPLGDTAGGRRAFWAPADELVAAVRSGTR